ncbi:protein of unknown function [Halolactibacillus halophilus]|uniref:Membrane protein n=1 Tax=Halolactibacillus halophilus TaxID=306540 RepID=A0A1I5LEI5_9BACI|nr:ImmA/IrrE family metallo-endopeptidase [Halolactibacillus halophilus]GEM00863.1 membrane protein [Halolactibacillus halophilus]SFO95605.1 protein of unknown function [Halolactibacillus halophilus]
MTLYDNLLIECDENDIEVYEMKMSTKGLYSDNVIWINKSITGIAKRGCVLAEELGHHYTSVGNILNQSKMNNIKQEKRARSWAYEKVIPLNKFIEAHKNLISSKFELAEFLSVTEDFLDEALERYKEKYGLFVEFKGFTIRFEPLAVFEWFEYKNF